MKNNKTYSPTKRERLTQEEMRQISNEACEALKRYEAELKEAARLFMERFKNRNAKQVQKQKEKTND